MSHQSDSMKWINDQQEAPADRQVALAIGGVLGSFLILWGAVGYMSDGKLPKDGPVARNDLETVQLLPRGAHLDDPQPLDVPNLDPLDLPEGAKVVAANGVVAPGTGDEEARLAALNASQSAQPTKEKGGLWGWVTSIFDGDKETEKPVKTQSIPSRPAPQTEQPAPDGQVPAGARPQPGLPAPAAPAQPAPEQPAPAQPAPQVPDNGANNTTPDPTMISELIASLRIAPEQDGSTFVADAFGEDWADIDENQCSTRHDILARDLKDVVRDADCHVVSGKLTDPYSGQVFDYVADPQTDDDVQIDHIVSLKHAWMTGAQDLPSDLKVTFKNDPLNLVTVLQGSKEAKGDSDAAQWLPTTPFRCEYIARQIAVKARYGLWVSPNEHTALQNGLASCPVMRVDGDQIVNVQPAGQ